MFLWCHVRHINPLKMHPERIAQNDKNLVNDLNRDGVGFCVREKIETKRQYLHQCVFLRKQSGFSNIQFKSKNRKLDGFITCN